jgi:hypothetical protein
MLASRERDSSIPDDLVKAGSKGKRNDDRANRGNAGRHRRPSRLGQAEQTGATGLRAWVREHAAWRRFALVTDSEWAAKAMHMFTWLTPGEVSVVGLDQEEEAKRWVAG